MYAGILYFAKTYQQYCFFTSDRNRQGYLINGQQEIHVGFGLLKQIPILVVIIKSHLPCAGLRLTSLRDPTLCGLGYKY